MKCQSRLHLQYQNPRYTLLISILSESIPRYESLLNKHSLSDVPDTVLGATDIHTKTERGLVERGGGLLNIDSAV